MCHHGFGYIKYNPHRPGLKNRKKWWCVVEIKNGEDLVKYYRWWLNKVIFNPLNLPNTILKPQSWPAHISVVRGEMPDQSKQHLWKKYDGELVKFKYDHVGKFKINPFNKGNAPGYAFFVEVECEKLINIRKELGLKCDWPLHITFGRTYET